MRFLLQLWESLVGGQDSTFLTLPFPFWQLQPEGGKERKGNPIAFLGLIDGDPRMIEDKTAIFQFLLGNPAVNSRFPRRDGRLYD